MDLQPKMPYTQLPPALNFGLAITGSQIPGKSYLKGEPTMAEKGYRELLEVMKSRGGPYAGLDIPEFFALVEELFDS
jgi:hypothetical protein